MGILLFISQLANHNNHYLCNILEPVTFLRQILYEYLWSLNLGPTFSLLSSVRFTENEFVVEL